MRCFKCQEFGHIAKVCKGKRRCARCNHKYGRCEVQPKCCHCRGEHNVAFWGCEAMRCEIVIQWIRLKEKVSYAKAVKRAGQDQKNREQQCEKRKGG